MVILYNGRDHFVPSIIMNQVEYNQWKLSILVTFAEASLDVIDDVDSNFVSPEVAVHLTNMKQQFLTTRALHSEEHPLQKQQLQLQLQGLGSLMDLCFPVLFQLLVCLRVLLVVLSPLVMYLLLLPDVQVEKGKQVLSSTYVTSVVLLKVESQI